MCLQLDVLQYVLIVPNSSNYDYFLHLFYSLMFVEFYSSDEDQLKPPFNFCLSKKAKKYKQQTISGKSWDYFYLRKRIKFWWISEKLGIRPVVIS